MKFFAQFQQVLLKVLGVACVVVFAVLVLDVLYGVVTRHFSEQPAWTEELARLLLVWLAILGGVLAYAADRHLGVDILVSRFDSVTRPRALAIGHFAVLAFAVSVLLIGGLNLFLDRLSSGQMMAALGVRKAWFYFVLPVGGFLIAVLAVEKIIINLFGSSQVESSNEEVSS